MNKQFDHIDDNELLEKFYATKDNYWLGILLQRYTLLLLGTCMKYLKNENAAKDSVQQVFLKAISELHKYKVSYFKSWIYMIAKNHCLMQLRNKSTTIDVADTAIASEDEYDKEAHINFDKDIDLLQDCLQYLTTEQRDCIVLFYLKKKSYTTIAASTGFTMMQVKSYIQNGKRNLKILMEK